MIVTETIDLETITCGECGIIFAMPERLLSRLKVTGDIFYCPNGHARAFLESEIKKLEKKLQRERQKHDQTRQFPPDKI